MGFYGILWDFRGKGAYFLLACGEDFHFFHAVQEEIFNILFEFSGGVFNFAQRFSESFFGLAQILRLRKITVFLFQNLAYAMCLY